MLLQANFAQEEGVKSGEIAASIYLNEIPTFVDEELQRLYGSIRSSLPYIRIFKNADQVNTYVAWNGAIPTAVLLFRVHKRSIIVLNERIRIDDDELRRFVVYVFDRFPSAGIIRFETVQADLQNFSYPFQQNHAPHAQEVSVINLPTMPEEYLSCLGSKTRKNIKYYLAKLKKDFPSFSFKSYERKEIDERIIYDLIRLKEAGLTSKKVNFSIDKDRERRMIDMVKLCGVVNVIEIEDRICAGSISYRVGRTESGEVIVHDPQYNVYSLGTLCVYLSICQSISKGVERYYMGAGKNEYKYRLLAVPVDMKELEIYRSPRRMILHGGRVIHTWTKARIFELTLRMHQNKDRLFIGYLLAGYSRLRRRRENDSM